MSFILGLVVFVVVIGILDSKLPWPLEFRKKEHL
jgi:hypothetical protein